ncbi:MAG: ABC transporter permease [Cytophagaceae bacterium]
MNLYYFISKKIQSARRDSFTYIVRIISILSIAVGLAVIIVSYGILEGFRSNIQEKIFSFASHIQVSKYDISRSYEEAPIKLNSDLYRNAGDIKNLAHIQSFIKKPGLLKTEQEVMGAVLKGVGPDYNIKKFSRNIIQGSFISLSDSAYSRDILISNKISRKLRLEVGDSVMIYFVQNPPRFRKLIVKGIYQTGLEEFDDLMIIGDLRLIQRINNWPDTLVGGYEIFVKDFNKLDQVSEDVFDMMDYDMQLEKVTDKYLQIFDWLTLLNRNVVIFLILILFVASFNMVSTLFIMIMERTNMIGMLKALGANNSQIRNIFLLNGLFIIIRGMLWGNLIGIGFCLIQYYFKIIPLDPENYYMSSVPIEWNWQIFVGINILTFVLISVVLMVPVLVVSRIKPVKSIKFS